MKSFALLLIAGFVIHATSAPCEPTNESFLPTWKLLNNDQKQQFVSGYLFGWRDAAKVTDVTIGFVKDNPQQAVSSLEKLKSLYSMPDIKPAALARQIDLFFSEPDNQAASLSIAVSSASKALNAQ